MQKQEAVLWSLFWHYFQSDKGALQLVKLKPCGQAPHTNDILDLFSFKNINFLHCKEVGVPWMARCSGLLLGNKLLKLIPPNTCSYPFERERNCFCTTAVVLTEPTGTNWLQTDWCCQWRSGLSINCDPDCQSFLWYLNCSHCLFTVLHRLQNATMVLAFTALVYRPFIHVIIIHECIFVIIKMGNQVVIFLSRWNILSIKYSCDSLVLNLLDCSLKYPDVCL